MSSDWKSYFKYIKETTFAYLAYIISFATYGKLLFIINVLYNVHEGIRELEVVSPRAVKRAARLFHRDGFVVVKDVLTPEQTQRLRDTCKVDKYQGWNQPSRSDTYRIFCRKIKEILLCNWLVSEIF